MEAGTLTATEHACGDQRALLTNGAYRSGWTGRIQALLYSKTRKNHNWQLSSGRQPFGTNVLSSYFHRLPMPWACCGTMRAACFSSLAPQMGQTPHASQVIATQKSLRRSTLGLKQAPDSSRPNLACIIHLHRSGRLPAAAADLVHYDVLVPLQHTTSTARFENGKRNT